MPDNKTDDQQVEAPQEQEQPTDNQEQIETQEQESGGDRTSQQFDKLKKSNQELKAERDKYREVLNSLKQDNPPQQQQQKYEAPVNQAPNAQNFQNLNQQQVNDAFSSMVDQDGYLDGNQLMQTLRSMDQRAQQADARAKQAEQKMRDYEETQQTREVYKQYPQLDPKSEQFDQSFYEEVYRDMVAGAFLDKREPGVNEYLKAAEKVYNKTVGKKDDKAQKEEKENQKRNINASRPRSTMERGYYDAHEEDALIQGARTGQKGAVAELLKRRGQ